MHTTAVCTQHVARKRGLLIFIAVVVQTSASLNLGLISGDLKRFGSPLTVKKYNRHSPVFINIKTDHSKLALPPLPKLPPKPPPLKLSKLKSKPSLKLPRSLLSPLRVPILPLLPPIIPPLPLLPIIPPLLPPILPLPILPLPGLSILPSLSPLKVPILGKSLLQKALASEVKPVVVAFPEISRKKNILENLLELKKRGSLTTAEFFKFKKLLL